MVHVGNGGMLRIQEASKRLGVSKHTVRVWANEGRIPVSWTPAGQRVFAAKDLEAALGKVHGQGKKVVCYSRVSSTKQRNDLERQREFVRAHLPHEYTGSECVSITDIGSGLNFRRPGLLRLLGLVEEGHVSAVVVASRDRLCRFGYELVEWMCRKHGTKIVVLRHEDSSPEAELGEDLMAIVQVYCCRWNGRRRYKTGGGQSVQVAAQADPATKADP